MTRPEDADAQVRTSIRLAHWYLRELVWVLERNKLPVPGQLDDALTYLTKHPDLDNWGIGD